MHGRDLVTDCATPDCSTFKAANPRFTARGVATPCNVYDAAGARTDGTVPAAAPTYAKDGRETQPADDAVTTTTVQALPNTLCLVCSGAQEFIEQPLTAAQITDPCWNPSGSTYFLTDDVTAADPTKYCVPNNGLCKTTTWQYATKNDKKTTSYWVGIQRGCQDDYSTPTTNQVTFTNVWRDGVANFPHGTPRAADGMEKFVRYYVASNTASKAKDLAKYPDAGTTAGSTVGIIPFAFTDGKGADSATDYRWADASSTITVGKDSTAVASPDKDSNALEVYYRYGWVGLAHGLATGTSLTGCDTTACVRSIEQPLTAQFMSADGNGQPDLPKLQQSVAELECLSCATPIGNTNAENNCVTAKTDLTVKCKTLACATVVSNYKLEAGETAETFYYAKRGCAANPDDGVTTGDQAQADQFVIPAGYTDIKQYNQRVVSPKANTAQASSVATATVMDCFSCSVHMTATVNGANPSEPTYDSIKSQDTSLCWQTFKPQADSSIAATGTSGRCETQCFVEAYKYKVSSGPTNNPVTTYNWHLERGCKKADSKMKTGTVQSKDLFGVTITNYLCDWKNGTLCNGQLENYDTTLQLKTQQVRQIQCFSCETPAGNTDPNHECYTVPSTAKAVDCGDLSYVSCEATETTFTNAQNVTTYGMVRGCSKKPSGVSESAVEGYANVMAKTTVCSTSSCNKVAGTTDNIVVAVGSGARPATEEANEVVDVAPESGVPALVASLAVLISMML